MLIEVLKSNFLQFPQKVKQLPRLPNDGGGVPGPVQVSESVLNEKKVYETGFLKKLRETIKAANNDGENERRVFTGMLSVSCQ